MENDPKDLPAPPVPADLDLRHFDCMHLNTTRLLNADLWDECTLEEIAVAVRLWAQSWRQVPCSSLPNDDKKLRRLAGLEGKPKSWQRLRLGALRGFQLCLDGRLYHGIVAETALTAAAKSKGGKRGAKVRWDKVKSLENNNTNDATAYNTDDGTSDGRSDSKRHSRTDGKTMQRREGNTLTPLPPTLATPETGSGLTPRPSRATPPADPDIDVGGGVIFTINRFGICDLVTSPKDAVIPSLTAKEAIALRDKAIGTKAAPTAALRRPEWYARAVVFYRTGAWPEDLLGPPPEKPGCQCPVDVIAEVMLRPEFNEPDAVAN